MQRIKLSDWKLCGFWPYTPFLGSSVETQAELRNVTPWIKASVPGGIYRDLQGAGLIEDPFFDTNSLKCEWVANRWWLYETEFAFKRSEAAKRVFLVFKGVDYKAHFYLNNSSLGTHEGMYTARTFDISEIVQDGGNRLRVLFEHPNRLYGPDAYPKSPVQLPLGFFDAACEYRPVRRGVSL